ncbi:TPA: GIY-YIG nuclease family protein [Legionella pneumophila]|uniref:GIY-YIG nuclease family protein n=2 Tax=Legionella pneumophila TaxID=446 RepID=UPI001374A043|nr:GIY-YIG nuclease family protein [Legionella pneumophila]HAT3892524.1 GIY-YIG nuclease family protein [Legionella pneumophila]HBD7103077.1 GIY-YIG nuclease family protein [Legionella pneumophila]HCO4739589.1 GIY-YIG nuclease family protein [Legionella pneumophila]HDU7930443.1 GIY-YIG nuclease family protein [Legionella pneumophila]HDU7936639.1 GIY-YIG nuclease family protein [Legionella pneumophila]
MNQVIVEMLIEFIGICQHCAGEIKILSLDGITIEDCSSCGQLPFIIKKVNGIIYILSNDHQIGVKIGLTKKTLEQRIKSLESTGVPGKFNKIAIFPSDKPEADEKRIHEKLRKHKISKEHFQLEPIDAVLGAYRALNKRKPIFYDKHLEETFKLKLEEAKIKMKLRLRGEN